MRKIVFLIVLCSLFSAVATAQVKDNSVEGMMTKRVLTCDDIYLNSISLIPKLYREKKADTLNAVISYWKKNCGMNEAAVCFTILSAIENGTFREELTNTYKDTTKGNSLADVMYYKNNILSYLNTNKDFNDIRNFPAEYPHYYYEAYVAYSDFIKSMAASLKNKPGLSPVEHFLLDFYARPDTTQISRLADSLYKGSLIQQAYLGDQRFGGTSYGLNFGMWHPTGNLAILGNHPFFGWYLGGRGGGFSCDFVINFAVGNTPDYYKVRKDDSVYTTNYFVGYYVGLDFGQALFRTKKNEVAVLAGIAYDGIATIKPDNSNNNNSNNNNNNGPSKTLGSLNLNAGLGYKFYLTHVKTSNVIRSSYIALQVKYNLVNYCNGGGTDLSGNSINFCVIWGGYNKHIHHYWNKD